jgi:hypothetical protein
MEGRRYGAEVPRSVPVDIATVRDVSGHEHKPILVVDRVDDAMVANPDAVIIATGELDGAVRAGIGGERVDGGLDAVLERCLEPAVGLRGLAVQADVVAVGYPRTSDHGIVSSASSRAWNAARLSSRYSRRSMSSA